jgi:hypothetical protein
MSGSSAGKTLYLDASRVSIRPDGDALRVQRPGKSDGLIPLRRIDRAVIHDSDTALLQACLSIVSRGGTVHFQDAAGNLCGILQQPWADGTQWARDTARLIEHSSGRASYRSWRNTQRRHAWSLGPVAVSRDAAPRAIFSQDKAQRAPCSHAT